MTIFEQLSAPFPPASVHWRCQTLTKGGDKGLALAYIDARHVMNRLDAVVGPDGWQDRYEVHGSKTICYLSIRVNGEWVTKADGAGDTDVEAEKGSISDAFKRVAVKWGIGRYLYDLDATWVPCEVYEKNGKSYWQKWTVDPWTKVRNAPKPPAPAQPPVELSITATTLIKAIGLAETQPALAQWFADNKGTIEGLHEDEKDEVRLVYAEQHATLKKAA